MPVLASALSMKQMASPAAPAAGSSLLYPKSDGKWYTKDSTGAEAAIAGGAAGVADTGWQTLSLPGGWNNGLSAFGWPTLTQARKIGDLVYLQGMPQNASGLTTAVDGTIVTLPVGFRPKTNIILAAHAAVGSVEQHVSVRVFASGAVTCGTALPNGSWISLNVAPFAVT